MLIDTHCHLEMHLQYPLISQLSQENYQTVENIINEAYKQDVTKIVNISTTYERCLQGISFAQKFSPVYVSVGIHPCDITTTWHEDLKKIKELLAHKTENKIVGIGETGLDFYHPGYNIEQQENVFRNHIELALEHDLALVIHTRNALDETLEILHEYRANGLRGVIHCFSGDLATAHDIQKLNFMMGIGGIITYPKNEELRSVVKALHLKNMVLETDAPFLPPQHMRGKQNNPAQVRTIADYCAELLQIDVATVAKITSDNANALFKF